MGAMAWLVLRNKGRLTGFTGPRMIVFVLLSVYAGFVEQGIDNAAHITGLIAGFLLAMLVYRKPEAETEVIP